MGQHAQCPTAFLQHVYTSEQYDLPSGHITFLDSTVAVAIETSSAFAFFIHGRDIPSLDTHLSSLMSQVVPWGQQWM
jgi:hypothetical protein